MSIPIASALFDKVELEGNRILKYWQDHVLLPDGSFHGEIAHDGKVNSHSPRGAILASRILWTFSRAINSHFGVSPAYRGIADRSYNFLKNYFWDTENLGFFWMIDEFNQPVTDTKHIYAQAFALYALTEYHAASGNNEALHLAELTYTLIERYARDAQHGGYFESFTRCWTATHNSLLDPESLNSDSELGKSMNTHLHVLEAYTQLYRVWPNTQLKTSIQNLLDIMSMKILNTNTYHFELFFDATWTIKSDVISFGHDIEGSWLMAEAAEVIEDPVRIDRFHTIAIKMVDTVLAQGLDTDYGVFNEGRGSSIIDDGKDWWPQAEAVVGCINAYQISGHTRYLEAAQHIWNFIEQYMVDQEHGDWYWKVFRNGQPDVQKPIVEPWKCPYHNTRACMEVWQRLSDLEANRA